MVKCCNTKVSRFGNLGEIGVKYSVYQQRLNGHSVRFLVRTIRENGGRFPVNGRSPNRVDFNSFSLKNFRKSLGIVTNSAASSGKIFSIREFGDNILKQLSIELSQFLVLKNRIISDNHLEITDCTIRSNQLFLVWVSQKCLKIPKNQE